jgi:hypothetical protein
VEITVERRVGRLVEVRVAGTPVDADAIRFRSAIIALAARLKDGEKLVSCSDLRKLRPRAAARVDEVITAMRASNARTERAALIVPDDAVAGAQVRRIVEEGHLPARKIVLTPAEAIAWLEPVLTPAELVRLRKFLAS